ncbi:hypothetical protein AOLI_G00302390 [Acnodon oligacanthus]
MGQAGALGEHWQSTEPRAQIQGFALRACDSAGPHSRSEAITLDNALWGASAGEGSHTPELAIAGRLLAETRCVCQVRGRPVVSPDLVSSHSRRMTHRLAPTTRRDWQGRGRLHPRHVPPRLALSSTPPGRDELH